MTTDEARASSATEALARAKRPDIGDQAVAVVRHLWVHPVHDPKCEVCRFLRDGKSGKS